MEIKSTPKCIDCVFNYDGIECMAFTDRYKKDVDETFDPYEGKPDWCDWEAVVDKRHLDAASEEIERLKKIIARERASFTKLIEDLNKVVERFIKDEFAP